MASTKKTTKKTATKKTAKKTAGKKARKTTKKTATKKKTRKTTKKTATKKKTAKKTADRRRPAATTKGAKARSAGESGAKQPAAESKRLPRVFAMAFASVYPLYVQKAEKKGRTKAEVDQVIAWLTGYKGKRLQSVIDRQLSFEAFFAKAPKMNPNVDLITGVVCGVRVEDVEHPLMRQIRYLDKLVDELARGKKMQSILRA